MIASVPATAIYSQPILNALHNLLSTSIVNIIDPPTGSMMQQSLITIHGQQLITWTFGNLSSSLADDAFVSIVSPVLATNVAKSLLMVMAELGTGISVTYRNPLQCDRDYYLELAKDAFQSVGGWFGFTTQLKHLQTPLVPTSSPTPNGV
jgi:hypothetical protein